MTALGSIVVVRMAAGCQRILRSQPVLARQERALFLGTATTKRPSGCVGTIVNPGRVCSAQEKAVTTARYWPSGSGRRVESDQAPVPLAVVPPARTISGGRFAGPT